MGLGLLHHRRRGLSRVVVSHAGVGLVAEECEGSGNRVVHQTCAQNAGRDVQHLHVHAREGLSVNRAGERRDVVGELLRRRVHGRRLRPQRHGRRARDGVQDGDRDVLHQVGLLSPVGLDDARLDQNRVLRQRGGVLHEHLHHVGDGRRLHAQDLHARGEHGDLVHTLYGGTNGHSSGNRDDGEVGSVGERVHHRTHVHVLVHEVIYL